MFRPRLRRIVESAWCIAVIGILPMTVLYPAVFSDQIPISTDSIFAFPPWEEARPADITPSAQPEEDLMAQRYYPWYVFLSTVGNVEDILWNPLENAGLPFLALWRSRCLSPFTLPFYIFDTNIAITLSIYLKLFIAGLCAFIAAARLGYHRPIALFVALAFQFSGGMLLWAGYPITDVLPWLPLLILQAEQLHAGQLRQWPALALVMALMLLGGEPEAAAVFALFALLWLFVRARSDKRKGIEGWSPILIFLLAALIALCACGIQIAPYVEFITQAREDGRVPSNYFPQPRDLVALVAPQAHGAFTEPVSDWQRARVAGLFFVGLPQILMFPLWIALRSFANERQRQRIETLLGCSLIFTLATYVLKYVIGYYPALQSVHPEHFLAVNSFVLSLAAAGTADEWVHLNAYDCTRTMKRWLVIVVLLGIAGGAAVALTDVPERLYDRLWHRDSAIAGAMAVCLLLVLVTTIIRPSPHLLGYTLCFLGTCSLVTAFGMRMPFTATAEVFPVTPFIELFKQSGARVSGSDALRRWPLSANLVPQIFGSSDVSLQRQADFHARISDDPLLLRRAGSPLLLLAQEDIQDRFAPVRSVLRVEKVFPSGAVLFYDIDAKPQVWLSYEGRMTQTYDPKALSSTAPPLMEEIVPPAAPPAQQGEVTMEPPTKNTRFDVALKTEARTILVMSDAWYPGWKAKVDDTESKVFPVHVLFRGVEIPAGTQDVTIYYDPLSIKIGAGVSAGALLVIIYGLLRQLPAALKRIRRRRW